MEIKRLLYDWRVLLVLVSLAISLWVIRPQYTAQGWTTAIPKGFDIQGGARAIIKPSEQLSPEGTRQVISILQERLNIYGLRDISLREVVGSDGTSYIIVEAAGMTEEDVRELLTKQGKFEAKIGNETIFTGTDIIVQTYESGVTYSSENKMYRFYVSLKIMNQSSMQKFADVTGKMGEEFSISGDQGYLSGTLDLYIDNNVTDKLRIASSLKGKIFDSPVVEGGANTKEEAVKNMERMQAILQTGALPVKLDYRCDACSINRVSPKLGEAFINNTLLATLAVMIAVSIVIFVKYREMEIVIPIIANSVVELILTLGVASLIKWQLDLASIAGLITSIGTGVDSEIIMTDEAFAGEKEERTYGIRAQLKRAGFIMLTTFGTIFIAMLPLMFIGFGAIRGFAITTIIGVCVGFFITRPAYLLYLDYIIAEKKM